MPRNYRKKKTIVKTVKAVLNRALETKHTDRSVLATTYSDTGSVYNLTAIAGGSAEDARNGEKITVCEVRVTAVAVANAAGAAAINQTMRMLIVRDNFADGNIPALNQVLESTGNLNTTISNYNIDYHKRFTVLKDCFFNLSKTYTKGQRQMCVCYKKMPVWYTGALSTDEGKGQIYLMLCSDVNIANGNYPYLNFTSRVSYKDA